ncbi:recombinase family protein [Candidatus Tisiphia endosymbiont of Beris chalybata]|uniref:recombinase family protein n=1 Tax=Candidatus Tisiphia endosymbiont of Beris chalybata TaxID=3066262 RepID=UPI00312CA5E9
MLIGYARVSTVDQNLDLQLDALKKVGCEKLFEDKITGSTLNRPGLSKALGDLRRGDTLVVWKLDRLGRSLRNLIELINELQEKDIMFRSIQDGIDTSNSIGQFFFHITGAFGELERNLIKERTKAGLDAARTRGRTGGRKASLNNKQIQMMLEIYNARSAPIIEICEQFKISRKTFYRYIENSKS